MDKQPIPEIDLPPGQRIALRMISMPPRMLKVADYLAENWLLIPFMGIEDLAQRTGTDNYIIIEMAKLLGYSGWLELKKVIWEDVVSKVEHYYSLEDKTDAYYTIYRNINTEKRYQIAPKCYKCGHKDVFWHKRHWYFATRNGRPEPEIAFCPFCGQKLNKTYPHTSKKAQKERKERESRYK